MEHTSNVENGANLKLTITNGIATLKPTTVKACAGNRSGSKWDKGERDRARARARERERDTVNEWVWTVIFDSALQSNSNTWIWCETKLFRFNDWLFPSIDKSLWEESEKKKNTHHIYSFNEPLMFMWQNFWMLVKIEQGTLVAFDKSKTFDFIPPLIWCECVRFMESSLSYGNQKLRWEKSVFLIFFLWIFFSLRMWMKPLWFKRDFTKN